MKKYIMLAMVPLLFQHSVQSNTHISEIDGMLMPYYQYASMLMHKPRVEKSLGRVLNELYLHAGKGGNAREVAVGQIVAIQKVLESNQAEQIKNLSYGDWLLGSKPAHIRKKFKPALDKVKDVLKKLHVSSSEYSIAAIGLGVAALTVAAAGIGLWAAGPEGRALLLQGKNPFAVVKAQDYRDAAQAYNQASRNWMFLGEYRFGLIMLQEAFNRAASAFKRAEACNQVIISNAENRQFKNVANSASDEFSGLEKLFRSLVLDSEQGGVNIKKISAFCAESQRFGLKLVRISELADEMASSSALQEHQVEIEKPVHHGFVEPSNPSDKGDRHVRFAQEELSPGDHGYPKRVKNRLPRAENHADLFTSALEEMRAREEFRSEGGAVDQDEDVLGNTEANTSTAALFDAAAFADAVAHGKDIPAAARATKLFRAASLAEASYAAAISPLKRDFIAPREGLVAPTPSA